MRHYNIIPNLDQCQVTIQEYSLDYFGKTDQFVGFSEKYSSFSCHTVISTVIIALLPHSCLLIITDFNKFYIIKAMSIRELTWQIKQVVQIFLQERRHIGRNIKCFLFAGKVLSIDQISILYSAGVLRTKCIHRCMSLISR